MDKRSMQSKRFTAYRATRHHAPMFSADRPRMQVRVGSMDWLMYGACIIIATSLIIIAYKLIVLLM